MLLMLICYMLIGNIEKSQNLTVANTRILKLSQIMLAHVQCVAMKSMFWSTWSMFVCITTAVVDIIIIIIANAMHLYTLMIIYIAFTEKCTIMKWSTGNISVNNNSFSPGPFSRVAP